MISQPTTTVKLLTIIDIEERTGISARTIWRWISSGRFPKADLKVGKIRRWKTETLQEWIEKNG